MNVNAPFFLHFTKKKQIFKKILVHGLRYSYSCEYRPETIVDSSSIHAKNVIIIPMICFCDIPLSRTLKHRKKYGNFALGIDKHLLRKKLHDTLNIVSYYSSPVAVQALCNLYGYLEKEINDGLMEIKENPILGMYPNKFVNGRLTQKNLEIILAYFKPCDNRKEGKDYYDYTEEREWRAVLDSKFWNMDGCNDPYVNEKGEEITIAKEVANRCNQGIGNKPYFYLQFSANEILEGITHILLPTAKEAQNIADFISKSSCLFGTENLSEQCRLSLIRKINSFEQIEKDF